MSELIYKKAENYDRLFKENPLQIEFLKSRHQLPEAKFSNLRAEPAKFPFHLRSTAGM
jgi:hypothetical protein